MELGKSAISLALKGAAMGAANVIPGVSGGTIAFITGIYEELINSLKSFNGKAIQLLLKFRIKELLEHVNFSFLFPLFVGIGLSVFSLAKLLEYLFINYEVLTMAFFFGLILASVYLVGKQVERWNAVSIFMLLVGIAIAVGIAFLKPASPNASMFYVFICGIVAVSSMILPGLSGSYVLLLMGNYVLILNAVGNLDMAILIPLMVGCGVGLLSFAYLLSFIFKHFRDGTIGLLTGFVLGSLLIIWPWKNILTEEVTLADGEIKAVETGYEWLMPVMGPEFFGAVALVVIGAVSVIAIEYFGGGKPSKEASA